MADPARACWMEKRQLETIDFEPSDESVLRGSEPDNLQGQIHQLLQDGDLCAPAIFDVDTTTSDGTAQIFKQTPRHLSSKMHRCSTAGGLKWKMEFQPQMTPMNKVNHEKSGGLRGEKRGIGYQLEFSGRSLWISDSLNNNMMLADFSTKTTAISIQEMPKDD